MAVINLVLAVGLSVDYAAHVAHSFMIKTGTRDERMVQVCVGVVVLLSGCTFIHRHHALCPCAVLYCMHRSRMVFICCCFIAVVLPRDGIAGNL